MSATAIPGPEQVFAVRVTKAVANFGVRIVSRGSRVIVTPRVVRGDDENRLTGIPGLPLVINPYLDAFGKPRPVAGAIRPAAGSYDIVFETPVAKGPGAFTFRFWIDDVTPPTVRLLASVARPRAGLDLAVADSGSGVDPESLQATVDGKVAPVAFVRGHARVALTAVERGRHQLVFRASDYQELKNMENVLQILPNTRTFRATFRVR